MSPGRRQLVAATDFAVAAVLVEVAIATYTSANREAISFLFKITLPFAIVLLVLRGYLGHGNE